MAPARFLSHGQAARFYDVLGARLDTQRLYEAAALRDLAAHLDLTSGRAVIELGCGTGRFAAELLERHLSSEAAYLGLDISATMVALTQTRLLKFGERANVRRTDGSPHIEAADGAFDRFIATYVLDLLPDEEIQAVLNEAHRVLMPNGLLGLVSLTKGRRPTSALVSAIWSGLHRLSPWLVGGCRPIELRAFLPPSKWLLDYANVVVRLGISSDVIVARAV